MQSHSDSSAVDLPLDELVELVPTDRLSSITTHRVDDFHQLVVGVAVLQLLADVPQVVEVQLSLGLHIQQSEVRSSAFLTEGVALHSQDCTTLAVSSLRNCSKSRGAPLVPS